MQASGQVNLINILKKSRSGDRSFYNNGVPIVLQEQSPTAIFDQALTRTARKLHFREPGVD